MAQDVKNLQEALMLCGYYPGAIDGITGPNTEKAVKQFQRDNDLNPDGKVGPNTRGALVERLAEAATKASGLKGYYAGGGTSALDDM